ncbi:hypothetical protein BB560_007180 [Smittium megazygosporum]|uniref:Uncharacterized protein n=1 Tax=Smittium megazygosporum TaxID=133381 RepID=A0A2T9XY64_9FUNG|nr:hypothetical protein BB560_007180 [Smittium megazygosporum]
MPSHSVLSMGNPSDQGTVRKSKSVGMSLNSFWSFSTKLFKSKKSKKANLNDKLSLVQKDSNSKGNKAFGNAPYYTEDRADNRYDHSNSINIYKNNKPKNDNGIHNSGDGKTTNLKGPMFAILKNLESQFLNCELSQSDDNDETEYSDFCTDIFTQIEKNSKSRPALKITFSTSTSKSNSTTATKRCSQPTTILLQTYYSSPKIVYY